MGLNLRFYQHSSAITLIETATMRKAAEGYLRSLQRSPQRIKALFQKPSVRYAAA
jgi:hypothetical protein